VETAAAILTGKAAQRKPAGTAAEPGLTPKPAKRVAKSGASTRGARKATPSAGASAPPVTADTPGADKANALLEFASAAGWNGSARVEGASTIVVSLARGEQSIKVVFTDAKSDLSRMPAYIKAEGANAVQIKNVSAVKKIMAEPAA
jgi:hypothetical protein